MKIIKIFLLIFISYSCTFEQPARKEQIADKITAEVIKKIKAETGLSPIGTGGGMMRQIHHLAISFQGHDHLTIDDARQLLIYCSETYLSALNSNEKVRPYLQNYPFQSKDIEVSIFIHESKAHPLPAGALSVVGAVKGKLDYVVNQPQPPHLKTIRKETYQEALKTLAEKGALKNSPESPLAHLPATCLKDALAREQTVSIIQPYKGE